MKRVAKYAAAARLSALQTIASRGELYGRLAFVAVVIGVFSALWRAAEEAGLPVEAGRTSLVWYLAVTEWVLLSVPAVHVDIEGEVRRGDVAGHLTRPMSYPIALLARGLGALAVRAPVTGAAAFGCALVFTGEVPAARSLALSAAFAGGAMVLVLGLHLVIGLASFWLGEVSPVYWVSQKLLFILGGLMLPLTLYPEWLQHVAAWTPFPVMLAGPAGFVVEGGAFEVGPLLVRMAAWGALGGCVVACQFRCAVRRFEGG